VVCLLIVRTRWRSDLQRARREHSFGPEVTLDEAQGVFSSHWDKHNQVNVGMFHDNKESYKNIGRIMNYSLKHDCHMEFSDGLFYPWDKEWIVSYYTWIEPYSRGFQSLGTRIGSKGRKNVSVKEDNASDKKVSEEEDMNVRLNMNVSGRSRGHSEDDGNEKDESGAAVLSENSAIYRNCSV
jgi:hypothetical protein